MTPTPTPTRRPTKLGNKTGRTRRPTTPATYRARKNLDPTKPKCQHCNLFVISKRYALCWRCYYTLPIRRKYKAESGSNYPDRATWDKQTRGVRPDPVPTDAQPGSEEKIQVMAARYKAGEALFGSMDRRINLT